MRGLSYIVIVVLSIIVSCAPYDDTAIWDKLNEHEGRILKLEDLCLRLNEDISAQQKVLEALRENDYVAEVIEIGEDGQVVGYRISFSGGESVNVYHGINGSDGKDGADGADGTDGKDGADGHTPVIGIRKDVDGKYYWTLDGEWMTDGSGNRIPACGADGADGEDGEDGSDGVDGSDGADGIIPRLKIESGYWYVSYDEGITWSMLYKACTDDGVDGESFFADVDVSDPDYVVFVLADGSQIKLPTMKAFEQLQMLVNQMNTNISSLQQIVNALQNSDFVTGISPIIENGVEVGYVIYFSKNLPVTIYHGADGEDGADGVDGKPGADGADGADGVDGKPGADGADGEDGSDGAPGKDGADGVDGADGADGRVPVIGMQQDTDGNYYWTIDGEWVLDAAGEKVLAVGRSGSDGITPKLKIENGYWYVSYDGGMTWSEEPLGQASACDVTFLDVIYDQDYVYITLGNGQVIEIQRKDESGAEDVVIETVEVVGNTLSITGRLDVPDADKPYSCVTVYYSEGTEDFNVHTALVAHATVFDENGGFRLLVKDLKYSAEYRYCVAAKVRDKDSFGSVEDFTVKEFGHGCSIDVAYETGTFTGTGYYYSTVTTSIINGHGTPVLKSHMPEYIDGLQFYVKSSSDYTQPLTGYIGYMTDPSKIGTLKILKSFTHDIQMTASFSLVTIPLHVTREELAEVPDDGVIYVGYYPPEGHNSMPIGCGYTDKTGSGYVETPDDKGVYSYQTVKTGKYTWAVSSQKNPRYAAFVVLSEKQD